MNRKILIVLLTVALTLGLTVVAFGAGSDPYNINVTATATTPTSCTVVITDIAFGPSDGTATIDNAGGNVNATCTAGAGYTMSLNQGQNYPSTTSGIRAMVDGIGIFEAEYIVWQDAGHTTLWGDGTLLGTTQGDTGNDPTAQDHLLYAQLQTFAGIPGGTALSDVMIVTVTY